MQKITLFFLIASFQLIAQNQACDQEILNIVMILDASGSIGLADFQKAKDATIDMVQQMNVNPRKVHVGYIYYASDVRVAATLLENEQDKQRLINQIRNIPYLNGMTATGDALEKARFLFNQVFRSDVPPKIAVLFTDGQSNYGSVDVKVAADRLKADKVDIFVVGIGPSLNMQEIQYIASDNSYIMVIDNYSQFLTLANIITNKMCQASAFVEPNQKVVIESPQNQKRNFQTDLTSLKGAGNARASIIVIDMTILSGTPLLSYSLTNPMESRSDTVEPMIPHQERVNSDNSRTLSFYVFPSPSDKRLYMSVKGTASDNKYELVVKPF